jgi:uncharacterized protein
MLAALLLVAAFAAARAEFTFPALTGRVVDAANLLSPAQRAALEQISADHEAKSTDQLVIATVPSLQGTDVADYGNRLFRHWQLGQKDKNNGVLLLVAPNERRVRIEVGYGLEGVLTDAMSRIIIESSILPRFRAGDFPGGIERGAQDIVRVLQGDAADLADRARARPDDVPNIVDTIVLILVILVFVSIFISILRDMFRRANAPRSQMSQRGQGRDRVIWLPGPSSGSWGGGGGDFGGGGGLGGGGGSSGGGGASGSW